jgi:hypothetical protein
MQITATHKKSLRCMSIKVTHGDCTIKLDMLDDHAVEDIVENLQVALHQMQRFIHFEYPELGKPTRVPSMRKSKSVIRRRGHHPRRHQTRKEKELW